VAHSLLCLRLLRLEFATAQEISTLGPLSLAWPRAAVPARGTRPLAARWHCISSVVQKSGPAYRGFQHHVRVARRRVRADRHVAEGAVTQEGQLPAHAPRLHRHRRRAA
jgi:hypothetical protein